MQHITSPKQQPGFQGATEQPIPDGWIRCGECKHPFSTRGKRDLYCSETCRYNAMMRRRKARQSPEAQSDWMPSVRP
ncbi:MAG: hypothetical protein M3P51_09045 [Chloroflexota bacterium]|nr:hypothetical protein [Chloroflexota bacterium]